MKRLIIMLIAVLGMAFSAHAQVVTGNTDATDTVTNTSNDTMTLKTNRDGNFLWSVQVTVTRVSGTLDGVVRIYGSNDGTNFIELPDTIDITNAASVTGVINVGHDFQYKYFRVIYFQSGTTVGIPKYYWYYKPE